MVYLDNAATTFPKYHRQSSDWFIDSWLNSNSQYALSTNSKLDNAISTIKTNLGVKSGNVLFFRCATEAIEWLGNKIDICCTRKEHDSVYDISKPYTESIAIAHQYVNQMTGSIYDIKSEVEKDKFFISDFTAAIGKVELPKDLDSFCDAIWFSGHKFHTEKNIGAMWISDRLMKTLGATDSSSNQFGLVHGTLDVMGAEMIATGFSLENSNLNACEKKWNTYINYCISSLNHQGLCCKNIADNMPKTCAINSLYLKGVDANALCSWLASHYIYVGLGHSACADNDDYRVLNSFGLSNEEASNVIRVSFSKDTKATDICALTEGIVEFHNLFKE